MERLKGNIILKLLSAILSYFTVLILIISIAGMGIMLHLDFYTKELSTLSDDIMTSLLESEVWYIGNKHFENINFNLEKYYSDKNLLFVLENEQGEVLASNYNGEKAIASIYKQEYYTAYITVDGQPYHGNVWLEEDGTLYNEGDELVLRERNQFFISVYIPESMEHTDRFYIAYKAINLGYSLRYALIFISVFSLIMCVFLFIFMFSAVGHSKNSDNIKIKWYDRIPTDLYTLAVVLINIYTIYGIGEFFNGKLLSIVLSITVITLLYFLNLAYLLSVAVKIKTKLLFKNTLIYYILRFGFKILKKLYCVLAHIYKNLATVYKALIIIVVILGIEFIYIVSNAYELDNLIIGWIVMSAILTIVILLAAVAFQKVKRGGERIVSGDLETKIDTKYMYGDIKDFGDSLNNINNGLQAAINDKMKSERLKTELITNVSHDIKTPLTSIVNYVDLIKKEETGNQKINEYINVLERQSSRLKKLIEDLVEASKASTGNISIELNKCDLSVLVNQAVGEFSERLKEKNLELVYNETKTPLLIMADGRRLWRVFDNLLNNICKYAMPSTRVYIDLKSEDNRAVVLFRNISSTPLNITAEELTERFVRGDRSRNTEGSGLGLSIAKSLVELQDGKLEIFTDADLFKASVSFDLIGE